MICSEFLLHLDDLLDDSVAVALRVELETHLATCGHCSMTVTTMRKTIDIYRSNAIYELPDSLRDRLQAAILAKCRKC